MNVSVAIRTTTTVIIITGFKRNHLLPTLWTLNSYFLVFAVDFFVDLLQDVH